MLRQTLEHGVARVVAIGVIDRLKVIQIKYADKLGIPYVWFPAGATDGDDTASDEVKNIVTGDQQPADPKSWQPDTVYARQTVVID